MNPLHAIWASSFIGALLFFCLGWAVSFLRRAPTAGQAAETLSAERTRMQEDLRSATDAMVEAQGAREDARRELADARRQVALIHAQAGEGQRELAAARDQVRVQVQTALEQRDKYREDAAAAVARVEALEVELRVLQQGQQERGGTLRELTAVQARLAAEQKSLRETRALLEKAQRASAELANREQRDRAREAEMEKLREQLRALEDRARQADQKSAELSSGLAAADGEYRRLSERFAESQQRSTALQAQHASAMEQLNGLRAQTQLAGDLEAENDRLRAELRAARESAGSAGDQDREVIELRKAVHDARLRLGAAEAKAVEADRLRTETASLRDQLNELPDLRGKATELDQLRAEQRTLRVDLAMALQRCESQQALAIAHADLERRVQELSREADEAAALRHRLASLEPLALAQSSQFAAVRPRSPGNGARKPADALEAVRRTQGFRSGAIASNQGLLVHGDGLAEHWEALAATGGLVSRFIDNVLTLLPLGSIQLVHVHGAHNTVLSCWMSGDETEPLVMTALGVGAPVTREVWQNVANPIHAIQVA